VLRGEGESTEEGEDWEIQAVQMVAAASTAAATAEGATGMVEVAMVAAGSGEAAMGMAEAVMVVAG